MPPSVIRTTILSSINEREVLRMLSEHGPLSRAEFARISGVTAPTASKSADALLRSGLVEEVDASEGVRGRPAKRLRLAADTAQVIGLVIDAGQWRLV
jgi:N-acetylglucosamine repressor